jgi:tetratricopeptide (TPR) repeat protein
MSDPRPKELVYAEELRYAGKVEESLEIIRNFEKRIELTPNEKLWVILLKGRVYSNITQYIDTVEMGERTYKMSQELGLVPEAIEALILKGHCFVFGRTDEALEYVLEIEKLLKNLPEKPYNHSVIKEFHLSLKSWVYVFKNDFNTALDIAEEGLVLAEQLGRKVTIGFYLQLICVIYLSIGNYSKAKQFAMKMLDTMRELNFQIGIAVGHLELGQIYYNMGDMNKALELINESLSLEVSAEWYRARSLYVLGEIYRAKGLLDIALEKYKLGFKYAMETSQYVFISGISTGIGIIYRQKGDIDQAKKFLEQGFTRLKETEWNIGIVAPTLFLQLINLDEKSQKQAGYYLSWLKKLADQGGSTMYLQAYQLGKAFMLRSSNRMRDNVKAEGLLKQIVDEDILYPDYHILAIISLCDFYLEELSLYNNQEVLEELSPLITQLLDMAEDQNSISWLVEGKVLQAKLSLIQMDIKVAKTLLTQAQQIAEDQDFNLLAQKISSEHDILLERSDEWKKLKNENAPMSRRIELASVDGVINRIQGKQTVDPPELVDEDPILLLIMDNSGSTYFNYPFIANWDHSDLFSSFLSAFNTFSDEIFSKSIDRIKIGENTILINPVESFLACYVIKGQSYPALQKLARFSEAIKENSEIWEALNNSVKTSELLELDKPLALKEVITEIFSS